MTSRPPTYSTARLDTLVCPVLVDSRELQSCLPARARLSLPRLPHVPKGRHPIVVEIWFVQDGLIELGGLTAHDWWALTGTVGGLGFGGVAGALVGAGIGSAAGMANGGALGMWLGPLGWWWGASAGAAAGAAVGGTAAATTGAMHGARWAADAAYSVSRTTSRVIGTYNEIIVTVPCRHQPRRGPSRDVAFVLGTYTDSMASIVGEWFVGWGYRKSRALATFAGDGALEVNTGGPRAALRLVCGQSLPPAAPAIVRSTAASVLTSWSHPLLGVQRGDRVMVSFLDRWVVHEQVRCAPTPVRLESGDMFLPGLSGSAWDLNAVRDDDPWGAFVMTGLPVRLSYPRTIDY
jgi:hypothetical protein